MQILLIKEIPMKSTYLSLILVFCLLLTACSTPPIADASNKQDSFKLDPKNPVKITLWHYYIGENQQILEAMLEEFNQGPGAANGVIIEGIAQGSIAELEEAVSNSAKGVINSQPMPDIFSTYPDKAIEIDALGMIADLNAYFTEGEKAAYNPDFLAEGLASDNRLLILPIVKSTELLYLNASAWEDFSHQTNTPIENLSTWEGLAQTARSYYQWTDAQTPDLAWDGKSMFGLDSIASYVLVANKQLGNDMIDAKTKSVILDMSILRTIFDIYVKAMAMEYFNASGKFRSDNIKSGDLIAYAGSSSSAAYFPLWIEQNNQRQNIDFMALTYPTFQDGQPAVIQQGAGMSIAKSDPKRETAAALFLKWFTQEEQNGHFAMNSGYLPVKKATYTSQNFKLSLENLAQGNTNQKNINAVYQIALNQIIHDQSYAAKPFAGSYKVRFILQSSLSSAAEDAKIYVLSLKAQNKSEAEIDSALDMDSRFEAWLTNLKEMLSNANIAYRTQ